VIHEDGDPRVAIESGTRPGCLRQAHGRSIGNRTVFPHSVQEPS
jgi:hypothetical protein